MAMWKDRGLLTQILIYIYIPAHMCLHNHVSNVRLIGDWRNTSDQQLYTPMTTVRFIVNVGSTTEKFYN